VGCAPLGSLLVGWLGGVFGPRWALFSGGAICIVAVLVCAVVYARTQHVEMRFTDHLWGGRADDADNADYADELAGEAITADVRSR
jgi:hypothetical protein